MDDPFGLTLIGIPATPVARRFDRLSHKGFPARQYACHLVRSARGACAPAPQVKVTLGEWYSPIAWLDPDVNSIHNQGAHGGSAAPGPTAYARHVYQAVRDWILPPTSGSALAFIGGLAMHHYKPTEHYVEEYDERPAEDVVKVATCMFEEIVSCVDRVRRGGGKVTAEEVTTRVAAKLRAQNLSTAQLEGLHELMLVVGRCATVLATATANQLAERSARP